MGMGARQRGLVGPTLVAFGLVVLLVCGIFAFVLHAVADGRHESRRARTTEQALVLTSRLTRLAVDLETGVRGRLLSGEERYLTPYRNADRTIPPLERQLRPLLTTAAERRRFAAVTQRLERYRRGYARRASRAPTSLSRQGMVTVLSRGKRALDDLRGRFDALRAEE